MSGGERSGSTSGHTHPSPPQAAYLIHSLIAFCFSEDAVPANVNVLSSVAASFHLWPLGWGSGLHNCACQWLRLSCVDSMAFYCLLFTFVALAIALVEINLQFSVNSAVTSSL